MRVLLFIFGWELLEFEKSFMEGIFIQGVLIFIDWLVPTNNYQMDSIEKSMQLFHMYPLRKWNCF